MIGKLHGIIDHIDKDHIILTLGGVGYIVYLTARELAHMSSQQEATFFIEMQTKDEQQALYGFSTMEEKRCFRLLQTVQGVGAKASLAILDKLNVGMLFDAIASKDTACFKAVPGIGPKIAKRIITELGDKLALSKLQGLTAGAYDSTTISGAGRAPTSIIDEAMQALEALGFARHHVFSSVIEIANRAPYISLEALVTEALRKLG